MDIIDLGRFNRLLSYDYVGDPAATAWLTMPFQYAHYQVHRRGLESLTHDWRTAEQCSECRTVGRHKMDCSRGRQQSQTQEGSIFLG